MTIYLTQKQADLLDILLSSDLSTCEDGALYDEMNAIRKKLRQKRRIREGGEPKE